MSDLYRNVVQPGRTLRSGRRGRRFESSHSDHKIQKSPLRWFFWFKYLIIKHEPATSIETEREKSCLEWQVFTFSV